MTIGCKFTLTCAALLLLTCGLTGVSVFFFASVEQNMHHIAADSLPGLLAISVVVPEARHYFSHLSEYIASTTNANRERLDQENIGVRQIIREHLAKYELTITQDEDRELFRKVQPAFDRFEQAWAQVAAAGYRADRKRHRPDGTGHAAHRIQRGTVVGCRRRAECAGREAAPHRNVPGGHGGRRRF